MTTAGASAPQNASPLLSGINGAALLMGENVWWVRPGANVTPAFAQKYFAPTPAPEPSPLWVTNGK